MRAIPLAAILFCFAQDLNAQGDEVDTQDAKALLAVGKRYEDKGQSAWAERCYKQVLRLGERPERPEAAFRLASIELARKRFEPAYARLRELASKYGHAGARDLLVKAENDATRQQRAYVENASKSLDAGKIEEARKLYKEAYDLAPEKIGGAAFVPRGEILPKIARCVDLIDDENYRKKIQPVQRSISPCTRCVSEGGFEKCSPCKGTGTVETIIRSLTGRVRIRKDPCTQCGEIGWLFCPQCLGLELAVDKAKLSPKEEKALVGVVNKVRALPVLRMTLDSALREVESVLLHVEEGAALSFFQTIEPKFTLSRDLKAALPRVPPDKDAILSAAPRWNTPKQGIRTRANFLLGYACEYARYLRGFDMLRGSQKKGRINLAEPPSASLHLPSDPVSPEVLSAFPEDGTAGWLAVKGTFRKYVEDASDFAKGVLDVSGDAPHDIHFFVWRPEAAKHLERFEKGPWSARVAGLVKAYPFAVHEKALAVPSGRRVLMVGRFLRDRLGFPRNWFEVWDLKVGLTPVQESLLHELEEPVDVTFPAVEVSKIAGFLEDWYGVHVELEGRDKNAIVDCEARDCPIGILVGEIAKCLGCRWYGQKSKVVLTRSPPLDAAIDADAVLTELAATARGELHAVVKRTQAGSSAPTGVPASPEKLPDDPALLSEKIQKASHEMDYAFAERCCEALLSKTKRAAEREQAVRLRQKLHLYHELTAATPVSHLAGARDLARIEIRNPAGGVHTQIVRIVQRGVGSIVIQPSYGGEAQVKSDWIRSEEPVGAEDFRSKKRSEINEQALDAEVAAPRDRVQKRFLLALAAKTNGFAELGTGFLDKAASEDELEWLIATYFPAKLEELTACWRRATGRAVATPRAVDSSAEASTPPRSSGSGLKADEAVPTDAAQLLPYARRHLTEGRLYLSHALPGMEEAQKNRKAAREHFEASRNGLDKLLEARPRDPDAIQLKRDVTMMIETCVKDLGFFD